MKILLIDNNDSFTYNLLHLIKSACGKNDQVDIRPGDEITPQASITYDRIVISPGPGTPAEAGGISEVIRTCEGKVPILGICLGHQVIAECYGASTYNLPHPVHGIRSEITITDNSRLFHGIEGTIMAGRYHSWCVSHENFPDCLEVSAVDSTGGIMGIFHRTHDIFGVQFHPESFMTGHGAAIISNFLNLAGR